MSILKELKTLFSSRLDHYSRGLLYDQLQMEFAEDNNLRSAFEKVGQYYERTGTSNANKMAKICYAISEASMVQQGLKGDFAEVALKYFPETEVSLMLAGEEYGLEALMRQLSTQCELLVRFSRGFKANVFSPLLLVSLIFGMFIGASYLIPFFGVDRAEWPVSTIILFSVGNFISSNNTLIFILAVFLYVWSRYARKNYTGKFRPFLDKYAPFNLYRMEIGAQFLFFYLLLVKSNRQFNKRWASLYVENNVPYVKDRINRIISIVERQHVTPAHAMQEAKTGFPDPEFLPLLEGLEENKVTMDANGMHPLERRLLRWIDRIDDKVKDALSRTNFILHVIILISLVLLVVGIGQLFLTSNHGSTL